MNTIEYTVLLKEPIELVPGESIKDMSFKRLTTARAFAKEQYKLDNFAGLRNFKGIYLPI
jgi:hypothetical protein